MTPDEFRYYGHQIIDWLADYREKLASYPVMSTLQPGEVRDRLPASPPIKGEPMSEVITDLEHVIMPGITHWNHPAFFAYFPSNASLASVLADLVSTGLGVQGMNWQTSPAATELEETVLDWLRQMLGLPSTFGGVIHDTASTATLVALLSARERCTHYSQNRAGLQAEVAPLIIYTSEESHSSIQKAALLAGFGKENLRLIETDEACSLRLEALQAAIEADLAAGKKPCALVATIGTTNTTAIDPLSGMAALAQQYGLWLHVDAAMAGNAMILEECRWMWAGVDACDSVLLNPHKWMGVAFDCTVYYVRDTQHLIRVMSTNPSYLQTQVDDQIKNFRDWGIPLGRRFRALKLWFLIREQGCEGLQTRLRRDLSHAQWFAAQIDATPKWQRVAPVNLQTVCVRHIPDESWTEAQVNAHNKAWIEQINDSGKAYLTPSMLKGQQIARVSIGVETTEHVHVQALWELMQTQALANSP
jgi:aromatic-L-amino-acid/L-tryptophan decarboxylase